MIFRYQSNDPDEQYEEAIKDTGRWMKKNALIFSIAGLLWLGFGAIALSGQFGEGTLAAVLVFLIISLVPVGAGIMMGRACKSIADGLEEMAIFFYYVMFNPHHKFLRARTSLGKSEAMGHGGDHQEKPQTLDFEAIKNAYGWTVSQDGELMALTSGDMGYEPTGIKLEDETLKIWQLGVERYDEQAEAMKNQDKSE